jgi:hypothetical protein
MGEDETSSLARPAGSREWSFDPVVLGRSECDAWVAYYRHEWVAFLRAAVGMVRTGFGMGRRRSLLGAWYVLRANQAWAPFPQNRPEDAFAFMRRFYSLVARSGHGDLDPDRAAALEVDWWRVHRQHQHDEAISTDQLTDCLNSLYSYVYSAPPSLTRKAARLRVQAMDLSDRWVVAGCSLNDTTLADERRVLVASYSALRDAAARQA